MVGDGDGGGGERVSGGAVHVAVYVSGGLPDGGAGGGVSDADPKASACVFQRAHMSECAVRRVEPRADGDVGVPVDSVDVVIGDKKDGTAG